MTQQYGQGHDSYSVGLRGMTSCLSQNIGLVSLQEMGPRKDTGNESLSKKNTKKKILQFTGGMHKLWFKSNLQISFNLHCIN